MEGAGATASSPVPIRIATPLAPSFLCVGVVGGDPPKSFAGFRHYLIPRHKSPARECRRRRKPQLQGDHLVGDNLPLT